MKKYYYITFLALLVITLLQGYNISLQYKDYVHNETDKVNRILKVAIDEEYAIRAHKVYNPHKDHIQRLYYKVMSEDDFLKQSLKKRTLFDFQKSTFKS